MTLWQEIKKELRWVLPLVLIVLIFSTASFWQDYFRIEKTKAAVWIRDQSEVVNLGLGREYNNNSIINSTDLIIDNSKVAIDGALDVKTLTITNNGVLTHNPADREGKINRYEARGDFWGLRFRGYYRRTGQFNAKIIKIEQADDGVKVIMRGKDNNCYTTHKIWLGEATENPSYPSLAGQITNEYTPIEIRFADKQSDGKIKLKVATNAQNSELLNLNDLYAADVDPCAAANPSLPPDWSARQGKLVVDYVQGNSLNTFPNSNFSNIQQRRVKTFNNSELIPLGTGITDGRINPFEHPWGYRGNGTNFEYLWQDRNGGEKGRDDDLAESYSNIYNNVVLRDVFFDPEVEIDNNDRNILYHNWWHSSSMNEGLKKGEDDFGQKNYLDAGLTINANKITLEFGGKIDVTGKGYPGYGIDGTNGGSYFLSERPGAVYEFPTGRQGGGYSDAHSVTGARGQAGAYGGEGGTGCNPLLIGGQPVDGDEGVRRAEGGDGNCDGWLRNTRKYGKSTNPADLGSGGGAGNDDTHFAANGGSGGGKIKITASELVIQSTTQEAIIADGEAAYDNSHNSTSRSSNPIWDKGAAGSGGSINVTVGTLTLSGAISRTLIKANGGASDGKTSDPDAGGGGGRVRVGYTNISGTNLFTNNSIIAKGGRVSDNPDSWRNGTDGTVEFGLFEKLVNNNGNDITVESTDAVTYTINYILPLAADSQAGAYVVTDTLPAGTQLSGSPTDEPDNFDSSVSNNTITWTSKDGISTGSPGKLEFRIIPTTNNCDKSFKNTATMTVRGGVSPPNATSPSVTVDCPKPTITGSIHSGGSVSGIKVVGPALVTAGGSISGLTKENTVTEIPLYSLSTNYKDKIMPKNIERLVKERAVDWPSNNSNLCQPGDIPSSPNRACEIHIEGGVFKTSSQTDTQIKNRPFLFQGTLIVQHNQAITLEGITLASDKFFGLIIDEPNIPAIEIKPSTIQNTLIYAPNSVVTFTGTNHISYTGIIVAQSINFQNKDVSITYPQNLSTALHLPPGFSMLNLRIGGRW